MKLTKRLLSILLVVCMVCSMLPAVLMTASAASGTEITADSTWKEVKWTDLEENDVFIFATTTNAAMSNATATNKNGCNQIAIEINSNDPDNLVITAEGQAPTDVAWVLSGDPKTGASIIQYGGTNYIYAINDSDGLRVGTTASENDHLFVMGDMGIRLKCIGKSRYMGTYQSSDWRSYTSEDYTNYGGGATKFYRLNELGESYNITQNIDTSVGTASMPKTAHEGAIVSVSVSVTNEKYVVSNVMVNPDNGEAFPATVDETDPNLYTFTMPASNVTVTVNFAEKTKATLIYSENGDTTHQDTGHFTGDIVALDDAPKTAAPEGYTFVGWAPNEVTTTDEAPEMLSTVTLNAEKVTVYAVYAIKDENGGTRYKLVTNPTAGNTYIIAAANTAGDTYALDAANISSTAKTEITATSVTILDDGTDKYIAEANKTLLWSFSGSSQEPRFSNDEGDTYLNINGSGIAIASSSSNGFRIHWSESYGLYGQNSGETKNYYLYLSGTSLRSNQNTGDQTKRVWLYEEASALKFSGYTTSVSVTPKHTVTWHIGDSEQTTQVAEGEQVQYPGDEPTKEDDNVNHRYYTFQGWANTENGDVLLVLPTMETDDIELYAVFEEHTFATVNWTANGETKTEYYRGGETPANEEAQTKAPAAPVKEYRFDGWLSEEGQTPEDVTVTEGATYNFTAQFSPVSYYTYTASASALEYAEVGEQVDLEATLLCEEGGEVQDEAVSYSVTFDPESSAEFIDGMYEKEFLYAQIQGKTAETVTVTVTFTISNGTEKLTASASAQITFYLAPNLTETDAEIKNDLEQTYDVLAGKENVPEGTQLLSVGANEEEVKTHPEQRSAKIGAYGTATIQGRQIHFEPDTIAPNNTFEIWYRIEVNGAPYYGKIVITVSEDYVATRLTDDALVLDFALPLTFDPLANDGLEGAKLTGISDSAEDAQKDNANLKLSSGMVTLADGKLTFTPTAFLSEPVVFYYFADVGGTQKVGTVTLIPATNVYYEDSFAENVFSFGPDDTPWSTDGQTLPAEQQADFVGAAESGVYGYDAAYATEGANYSMQSAHVATVSPEHTGATVEFEFYGTGFDVISMTGGKTGLVILNVTDHDGTLVDSRIIDTYYGFTYSEEAVPVLDAEENAVYTYQYVGEGNGAYRLGDPKNPPEGVIPPEGSETVVYYVYVGAGKGDYDRVQKTTHWVKAEESEAAYYQIPLIRKTGLPAGQYHVKIVAFYNKLYDHAGNGEYQFIFDAVRIYDPCGENETAQKAYAADGEQNVRLISLHDLVFESMPKLEAGYTAVFSVPSGQEAPEAQQGTSVTMPSMLDISAGDVTYTFEGWTDAAVTDASSTEDIKVYRAEEDVPLTGNKTFYALYRYEIKADGWSLITDTKDLEAGMNLVIVSRESNCVAGEISKDFMEKVEGIAFSGDQEKITTLPDDAVILTLGGTSGKWTLSKSNGDQLGASAVKKVAWNSGTQTWKITIDDQNNATVQNTTESFGRFLYNTSATRFTTYTTSVGASMLLPQLYKQNMTETHYTTTVGGASAAMREAPKPQTNTGIYIDGKDGASLQEYLDYGPANELELNADQAISFGVDFMGGTPKKVLLGIKRAGSAPGAATVTVSCGEKRLSISVTSETEMYYDITEVVLAAMAAGDQPIVILNGPESPLISLTTLKWTSDAAVTANLYMTPELALTAMRTVDRILGNEPEQPEDPSEPEQPVEPEDPSETEQPAEPEQPALTAKDFTDLDPAAWYYPAADYVLQNGLMNGIGGGKFDPEGTLDRAMIVTILYRQAGCPEQKAAAKFTDVPADAYYAKAVAWANEQGIALGATETTFEPLSPVTREQLVTFLWRYCGEPTPQNSNLTGFADVADVSAYAKQAMCWAVENGVINGDEGRIRPQGEATRAEAAAIFQRSAALLEKAKTV